MQIPSDRLLLETDCPDALPKVDLSRLHQVPELEERSSDMVNHPSNISVVGIFCFVFQSARSHCLLNCFACEGC